MDIAHLKKLGIDAGSYKKIFTAKRADYPRKVAKLNDLISNRIRNGRLLNFREWRAHHAVDLAYDVPFNQTTPTLVQNIFSKNLKYDQVVAELKAVGLSEETFFIKGEINGREAMIPNPPVFFKIFIPIVKAYVSIRCAKLFNDRNTSPFLPYKPLKETTLNRIRCEVITDITDTISTWFGYPAVLRQAILQMLKYGVMIAFPREEWYCEQQETAEVDEKGNPVVETVKEGLRYILPHPTRMFYDLNYPLTSLNTDSGCEFAGHWCIRRYGEILDDRKFWNRDIIFAGTEWWAEPIVGNFFHEVYPCRLEFPIAVPTVMQREDKANWYNSDSDRDKSVFQAEMFMKLIPKQWELGRYEKGKLVSTYDYPVWHRFIVAGDDTIIYAEPCAYNPTWFMGFDHDENASRNSSLGLELIPWQDHVGNIITQMLLTTQQNLANVIFYNNQVVDKEDILKLQNSGERLYRGMNFIGYDSLKLAVARLDIDKVFHNVQFNRQSIAEMLQMLPTLLNIMERVLQITSQEAGSAGPHQQSKAEIIATGGASANRLNFNGSFVDEGTDAWKRQLHDASQAYLDPEVTAEVSANIPDLEKHLEELGYTIKDKGKDKLIVKGKKKALRLEGFAATNRGPDPTHDKELAQIIFQTVGTIAGQPELFKEVGAKKLLTLIEQAAILAGAPRDMKLADTEGKKDGDFSKEDIIQAIQHAQQATLQVVEEKIGKPAAQASAKDDQRIQALENAVKALQPIFAAAKAQQDKTEVAKAELAIDQAKAQQEMKLREQEHAAELRLKTEQAHVDSAIKLEKAKADLAVTAAKGKQASKPKAK